MSGQSLKRSANQLSQETGIPKNLLVQLTGSPGPYDSEKLDEVRAFHRWLSGRKASPALLTQYQASQYEQAAGDGFGQVAENAMGGQASSQFSQEESQLVRLRGEEKAAAISAGVDLVAASILSGSGEYTTAQAKGLAQTGRKVLLGVLTGQMAQPYQIESFLLQSGSPAYARLTPSQAEPSGSLPPSKSGDGQP